MTAFATPIVLFVFDRPEALRRLLGVVAEIRPDRLFVVADGPRPGTADDATRCAAVRALVERVPWPCDLRIDAAPSNLGCDRRIASGIDWVFDQVDEAIFLEDDLVPDPGFFSWCAAMLSRYRDAGAVMQVAGRNAAGRWGGAGDDHHLVARASAWGWATWRRAWQAARDTALPGAAATLEARGARGGCDPLLVEHFLMLQAMARRGALHGWDTNWALAIALRGGLVAVPPANLVAHAGFDAAATHCRFADDLRALHPVGPAPAPGAAVKSAPDHRLDRWSLLLDLVATYRDTGALRRLARAPALVRDPRLRHHLAPFAMAGETLAALRHLRACISRPAALDPLIALFESGAAAPAGGLPRQAAQHG